MAEAATGNSQRFQAWLLAAVYRDAGQPEALFAVRGLDAKAKRSRATLILARAALNAVQ